MLGECEVKEKENQGGSGRRRVELQGERTGSDADERVRLSRKCRKLPC